MLDKVTITGASDDTPISELIALAGQYPFVEWAILVSPKTYDAGRWPTAAWMHDFSEMAKAHHMNVAMHLCGGYVRELLTGTLDWKKVPQELLSAAQRIQINTHAQDHVSRQSFIANLGNSDLVVGKKFIFQLDGVNGHLMDAALYMNVDAHGLFDLSHGAGVLPDSWQIADADIYTGFAGGLGPDSVVEQVEKIGKLSVHPGCDFWIDMEGRVRTEDDKLDLVKVATVLERCAPYIVPDLRSNLGPMTDDVKRGN